MVAMVAGKPVGACCMIRPGGEMGRSQMCSEERASGVSQNEETRVSIRTTGRTRAAAAMGAAEDCHWVYQMSKFRKQVY